MPLNYTIPALNTCDTSPHYCAISHFMLYIWQKVQCERKGEKLTDLQQIHFCRKFFTTLWKEVYKFVRAGE